MGKTKLLGMTMACGRSLKSQSSIAKSVNTHLSIVEIIGALPKSVNLRVRTVGDMGPDNFGVHFDTPPRLKTALYAAERL